MELGRILGLPAHPLLVHIPVALIPLTALGAIAIALSARVRARFGWTVVALAAVATVGSLLAAGSGEAFDEALGDRSELLRTHTRLGDSFIWFAVALLLVTLVLVVRHRMVGDAADRSTRTGTRIVGALVVLVAVVATGRIYQVGHSGAEAVWQEDAGVFDE